MALPVIYSNLIIPPSKSIRKDYCALYGSLSILPTKRIKDKDMLQNFTGRLRWSVNLAFTSQGKSTDSQTPLFAVAF